MQTLARSGKFKSAGLWLVLVAVLCLLAARASAFCRTTTCNDVGCPRDAQRCATAGVALSWPARCIAVELDALSAARVGFDPDEMATLLERTAQTWSQADCGQEEPPGLCLLTAARCGLAPGTDPDTSASPVVRVVFWDETWPFAQRDSALAHTTLEFDSQGTILTAEININSGHQPLTLSDTEVEYDLRTTMVHELGHALGLDHTTRTDSVMHAAPRSGELRFRELQDDDQAAVCTVYPPALDAELQRAAADVTALDRASAGQCDPVQRSATLCIASSPGRGHATSAFSIAVMAALLLVLIGLRRPPAPASRSRSVE